MTRLPLVYATNGAQRAATKLLRGRVLEVEVGRAIRSGKVTASERGGVVFLDELGLVASVARVPGRIRPKPRAWLVRELRPHRGRERSGGGLKMPARSR